MLATLLMLIFLSRSCSAVIYHLNDTEYARMPKIFHLEPYEPCLHADSGSGVYCSVQFDLVTDEPTELYDLITNYSAKTEHHFNHTRLSYGICLTKTCKQYYQQNTTADRGVILEACLNETFWNEYKLKTRVTDKITCDTYNKKVEYDTSDYVVAVILGILLALNLIGSLQEFYLGSENNTKGNIFLSCFAIRRNWKNLVAPAAEGPDPRLKSLVAINGIKALGTIFVVMGHSLFAMGMDPDNTHFHEEKYGTEHYKILATFGMQIVQSFLMASSFLLFYNMCLYAETHRITWRLLPKAVWTRWLRFTPAYAVTLAIICTWMRYLGSGPLYQEAVMNEVEHCRRYWWVNLLYINNYVSGDACFLQSWFIAADFQLSVIGAAVFALSTGRLRRTLLALLFVAGLVVPAAQTYFQDLDGQLLMTPENLRNTLVGDPTFHYVYTRGHSYLSTYVCGLAIALFVYHFQNTGFEFKSSTGLRFLFWMTVPAGLYIVQLGSIFYQDAPRQSVYVRSLHAALHKPLWAVNAALFTTGMIFKLETVYRDVMEWPGWTVPSRLCYSTYLVHFPIVRLLNGTRTTTINISFLHILELFASSVWLSFLAAIPLHLLVEAPFNRLIKMMLMSEPEKKQPNGDIKLANGEQKIMNGRGKDEKNGKGPVKNAKED